MENVSQSDRLATAGGNPFRPGIVVLVTLGNPREKFWGAILSLSSEGLSLCGVELASFDDFVSLVKDGEPFSPSVVFLPMHRVERMELDLPDGSIPSLSQRFTSKTHVVDAAQIKAFARQFDPQPFHLDDDAAKHSLFSGLVASGWHTAAITMRLLVERGLPLAGGVVGAGGELSWPRPTRPGDVLQVESEVLEIIPSRSRPDRGVATIRSLTRNQRAEVVQILIAKLIVPRRTHQ